MSDIEDGELQSSDEEECSLKNENRPNIKLNRDNNSIETADNNLWNYEQNNIKIEAQVKISNSDENDRLIPSMSEQKTKGRERKRVIKPYENNEDKKKRKSDDYNIAHNKSPVTKSFDHKDCPKPKRRILCKYYSSGECKNGLSCVFMHKEFPCKFFHDEKTTCRAGINCKFSHEALTDEMRIVLEGFIHDSKEKVSLVSTGPNNDSATTILEQSHQPRPNCLLPTPVIQNNPKLSRYDLDFTEAYHDIANYPNTIYKEYPRPYEHVPTFREPVYTPNNVQNYSESLNHYDSVKSYPDNNFRENPKKITKNNRSKFAIKFPKPGTEDFERNRQNSTVKNNPKLSKNVPQFNRNAVVRPLLSIDVSSENINYFNCNTNNNRYERHFTSNEENIVPRIFEDKLNPIVKKKPLNNKIHAPARFIISSIPKIKPEPELKTETNIDIDFQDALKKLAEQIVLDPQRRSPSLEKCIPNETTEKVTNNYMKPEIDTSNILRNLVKIENTEVRINDNGSLFKPDEEMSESEKLYIEEMKSLINLDAQYEDVIPWKLLKLDPVKKQPYILFLLKVNNLHDNPMADPRLMGHPVLNFPVKQEEETHTYSSDDEELSPLVIVKKEPEDPKSYLNNGKFKKRKIV